MPLSDGVPIESPQPGRAAIRTELHLVFETPWKAGPPLGLRWQVGSGCGPRIVAHDVSTVTIHVQDALTSLRLTPEPNG